jgi:hypothetical protein
LPGADRYGNYRAEVSWQIARHSAAENLRIA